MGIEENNAVTAKGAEPLTEAQLKLLVQNKDKDRGKERDRDRDRDRGRDRDRDKDRDRDRDRERGRGDRRRETRDSRKRRSSLEEGECDVVPPKRYWEDRGPPPDSATDKYKVGSRYYGDREGSGSGSDGEPPEKKPQLRPRPRKDETLLTGKTGGAYIPPAKLRMMRQEIGDKGSAAYQRLSWEALKKSIHGHINKVNTANIGPIIKQLLRENIVRGRGLLCRSVIQAQAASPTFTKVYAALVAAINSRFPSVGELLLHRLVLQFKRGFKRNDKAICISAVSFVAHLVNQRVAHEILALEILTLLVDNPTDDSVEVSVAFLKECGQKLSEVSAKGANAIFEMLRNILHEGKLDKRVQYMIEVVFQIRKDGFKDHAAVAEELELVDEEDQFTHLITLDEVTDPQDTLNVFKFDPNYEANEEKYKELCGEILGSDAESDSEDESGSGSDSESEEAEEKTEEGKSGTIIDNTETNLIALRRTIYLTIHSSLDFEECAHKLMKMQLKPGQEMELCHMFLDCCAEQRTYEKFYGLLAQRFCQINRVYIGPFEQIFRDSYGTAHRLDTNRLRNVSKFFAHLLFTDAIGWEVLECVKLNEEDTTSSSRIFIKILFQELAEYMGLGKLNERLKDPTLQDVFSGIFPRDNPRNTRFSINFFTSIGLGGLTDELREHIKQVPKPEVPIASAVTVDSESSSSSSSSSDSSDSSSDDSSSDSSSDESSESEKGKSKKKKSNRSRKSETPKTTKRKKRQTSKEKADYRERRKINLKDAERSERSNRERESTPDDRKEYRQRNKENERTERRYKNREEENSQKRHKEKERNHSEEENRRDYNERSDTKKKQRIDDEKRKENRRDHRERNDRERQRSDDEDGRDNRRGQNERRERRTNHGDDESKKYSKYDDRRKR